jgi:hypothetical protein
MKMAEHLALEGVIHGKIIELAVSPGLKDGERVHVVIRPVNELKAWGEGIKATAGALAHLPDDYFADLDEIVSDRQRWRYRETSE